MKNALTVIGKAILVFTPFCIVLILWYLHIYLLKEHPGFIRQFLPIGMIGEQSQQIEYGTLGDSYGSLNALYSGLAFAAVLVTLLLQAADLRATKQEMRNQTKEFKIADLNRRIESLRQIRKEIPICGSDELVAGEYIAQFGVAPERKYMDSLFLFTHFTVDILCIFYIPFENLNKKHIQNAINYVRAHKFLMQSWETYMACLIVDIDRELKNDIEIKGKLFRTILSSYDYSIHVIFHVYQKEIAIAKAAIILKAAGLLAEVEEINNNEPIIKIMKDKNALDIFDKLISGKINIEGAVKEWHSLQ